MAFNGTEGAQIPLADASAMTKRFRVENPDKIKAHFFGRDILNELLNQENCVGIRMYFGQLENGNSALVLAGVDRDENDLLELVVDFSSPCPPVCGVSNPLNS